MPSFYPTPFIVAVAVLSLNGCSRDAATLDSHVSQGVTLNGEESEIVDRLRSTRWTIDSSFYDLIDLCHAELYMSKSRSTCHISPNSDVEAAQFADALWLTLTGRTQSARQLLQALLTKPGWCIWGQAGLLHVAQYTENYTQLAALIEEYAGSGTACDARSASLSHHYSIALALATSDWVALDHLLGQLPRRAVFESPDFFFAQAELYFASGRSTELERLLAAASSQVQESTQYLTQQAKFAALGLGKGAGSWAQAFRAQSDRHKKNRALAIDAALSGLLDDRPAVVDSAVSSLLRIAENSPQDVRLLMQLSVALALRRQPSVSERVYRLIDTTGTSLQDFTIFHVLVAWNAIHRNDIEQVKTSIDSALAMAPTHYDANYLRALVAKREGDSNVGLEALRILQAADPYSENFQSMIREFYERYPTQDWSVLYVKSQKKWKVPGK